jgi:hypothetical protein
MSISSVIGYITNHPLNKNKKLSSIYRFAKWQIRSRINPAPFVHQFTSKSKIYVAKGMTGATGNLYCGLHEYTDMAFLLHLLRPNDLFADIGANVGSYTVLAAAHAGAHTITFEPLPKTFEWLQKNIEVNKIGGITQAYNIALGAQKDVLRFTQTLDTVNHIATANDTNTIEVPVDTLDNVLNSKVPLLMKIDVEGFETEVLKGASKTLSDGRLKGIIIELNGSGGRYGYDERNIHELLLSQGFAPYIYEPQQRSLIQVNEFGSHNTLYLRDINFIQDRLTRAAKINIPGYGDVA